MKNRPMCNIVLVQTGLPEDGAHFLDHSVNFGDLLEKYDRFLNRAKT